jgi:hypothetical protein
VTLYLKVIKDNNKRLKINRNEAIQINKEIKVIVILNPWQILKKNLNFL